LIIRDITEAYRGFELVVADPIKPLNEYPGAKLCQNIGSEPFQHRASWPLKHDEKIHNAQRFLLPTYIATAAALAYFGLLSSCWSSYNDSLTEYRTASQGNNHFDESMLRVLEARRAFLSAPLTQMDIVNNARRIATAIAGVDRVHIKKMFIRNDAAASKYMELSPDAIFGVVAEIPLENESMLEQAKPVLDQLAAATGAKLREIHQAVTTDTASGQKRLIMTFEGRL
jgi:hypothetical protein